MCFVVYEAHRFWSGSKGADFCSEFENSPPQAWGRFYRVTKVAWKEALVFKAEVRQRWVNATERVQHHRLELC